MRRHGFRALLPALLLVLPWTLSAPGVAAAADEGSAVPASAAPASADQIAAQDAFERIKGLAGTWNSATSAEEVADLSSTHEFRVSAAGTVVMEIMHPGSDHEMINMYHLDGDDLVMTHYCAAGNQPTMRLDRGKSTADHYVFEFTGGTNLDPAVDVHIHSGALVFTGEKTLDSIWTGWNQGKDAGTSTFQLVRADG